MKGSLYSIRLWGGTCLANHWNYYSKPACFTVNSVKQAGGWSLHPIGLGTSDHLPSSIGWSDCPPACFTLLTVKLAGSGIVPVTSQTWATYFVYQSIHDVYFLPTCYDVKLGLELWICSEVMHASHCGGSALLVWLHPSILQLALNIYVEKWLISVVMLSLQGPHARYIHICRYNGNELLTSHEHVALWLVCLSERFDWSVPKADPHCALTREWQIAVYPSPRASHMTISNETLRKDTCRLKCIIMQLQDDAIMAEVV